MSRTTATSVAGVDGCRAGWAVAIGDDVRVVARFSDVLQLDVDVIAVDMPIGLPDRGRRACDVEARTLLGDRRNSVFAAPLRALLDITSYEEALRVHRAIDGRGLSKQAFFLLPKIAEIDALLPDPRVVEAHPELAFARLLGSPATHAKRTAAGRAERLGALGLVGAHVPQGSAPDDVLDAIALTHTARRVACGAAQALGDGAVDSRGRAMAIWA